MDAEEKRVMGNDFSKLQGALRNVRTVSHKDAQHQRDTLAESNSRALADAYSFIERYAPKGGSHRRLADDAMKAPRVDARARKLLGIMQSLHDELRAGASNMSKSDIPAFRAIEKTLSRFHKVVKRLNDRHAKRPGFDINDEYDVQDLMGALLAVEFDDIRPEDYTPIYAGGSKRMDVVVKNHDIVIEAKITRAGRADKDIGDELCVDILHYKERPDCKTLVCFIYDPDQHLKNPAGLKVDLEKNSTDTFTVVVIVAPPH